MNRSGSQPTINHENSTLRRDAIMVASISRLQHSPIASLLTLFTAWKVLLLTLAILSPGPGYDTSTQLLFRGFGVDSTLPSTTTTSGRLAQKLTRWDGIYFASSAERGYQFEQEWAFGWGFTRAISYLAKRESSFFFNCINQTLHHPCLYCHFISCKQRRNPSWYCLCESSTKTEGVSINVLFWNSVS